MVNSRYLGAIILSPLIIFLFIGGKPLEYLIFALALRGMYEFYNILKEKNIHPISIIGYISCIIYYLTCINHGINTNIVFSIITLSSLILLIIPIINLKYNFIDASVTVFGFIYIAVFFSFIVLVNNKTNGNYLVWLIFLSSWVCDTAAYYTGKFFGKHKLCPKVSPKKTIEGSIGGLLGSIIVCSIFGMLAINRGTDMAVIHFFIIGALAGILSQFGDLAASSIKRHVGVKDYSNLIPGHGGILDRFDSILFSAVVVYYYLTFIVNL